MSDEVDEDFKELRDLKLDIPKYPGHTIIFDGETYEFWHGTYFKKSRKIRAGDCV